MLSFGILTHFFSFVFRCHRIIGKRQNRTIIEIAEGCRVDKGENEL